MSPSAIAPALPPCRGAEGGDGRSADGLRRQIQRAWWPDLTLPAAARRGEGEHDVGRRELLSPRVGGGNDRRVGGGNDAWARKGGEGQRERGMSPLPAMEAGRHCPGGE
jgi:hypothetical protein